MRYVHHHHTTTPVESSLRAELVDYIVNSWAWPKDEFIVAYRRWRALVKP